jgi:SAM-dependent methyltransferase
MRQFSIVAGSARGLACECGNFQSSPGAHAASRADAAIFNRRRERTRPRVRMRQFSIVAGSARGLACECGNFQSSPGAHAASRANAAIFNPKMSEWETYILADYRIEFDPEALVIDVGCGFGEQMKMLRQQVRSIVGIDLDPDALSHCRAQGFSVARACAGRIPIQSGTVDGVLCKVVLPYTNEHLVIREFGRLLKPRGRCYLSGHGAGYYLRYLLLSGSWKQRFYGLRSLVNTWVWILTGRRLPGFLGDTIYQSRRRLARYFQENQLSLRQDTPSKSFLGFPVFIYQEVEKLS